jgi:hypothetical protein
MLSRLPILMLENMILTQGSLGEGKKCQHLCFLVRQGRSLLFCLFEHMKRFTKCQITHYVERSEIKHPNHVELRLGILLNAFFELRDKLVSIFQEERLLLFKSAIRECRCEDLSLSVVIYVASLDKIGFSVHGAAVT